jgi:hypothetical protein
MHRFSKTCRSHLRIWRQNGDMKHVPYQGPTNIRHHLVKLSCAEFCKIFNCAAFLYVFIACLFVTILCCIVVVRCKHMGVLAVWFF